MKRKGKKLKEIKRGRERKREEGKRKERKLKEF